MCRNLVLEVILGFIEGKQHDRKLSSVETAYLNGQDGAVLSALDCLWIMYMHPAVKMVFFKLYKK